MVVDHICVNYGARLFQKLFSKLHERGVEQHVFYPRNPRHLKADLNKPYRIDSPVVLGALTKVFFSKKQQIMRQHYDPLFHRNKPDLIHAHTLFSDGSLANFYHEKYDIPFIVAIRSTDLDVFLNIKPWLYSHARKILENASFVVFISPSLRKKFLKKFGEGYGSKSLIIPNGIEDNFFQKKAQVKKEAHTPLELLYVGSFLKRKKVPALIRLAEKSEASLTIAGEGGSQEKKVLQRIRNSNLINYLGRIEDPSELQKIYRQHDIFIMTSRRETFGLVYLEAMSQGLPIIYSRNTGIDGLFKDKTVGYGVRPGSLSEMKEAIDRILLNYGEISANCISEALKYNWAEIAEKYLGIYEKATG
jgi:glycosyltransferase involved in cell wall biosynthesis